MVKNMLLFIALNLVAVSFASFPERCEGVWSGQMKIHAYGNLIDSVNIEFTVEKIVDESWPTGWIWKTNYLSEKMPMTKDYKLFAHTTRADIFLLDEGNGVILTNYVTADKMYSVFKVGKTWLTSSYEFIGDKLVFEVTSGTVSKEKSKGVTNYTTDFVQRVELIKVK